MVLVESVQDTRFCKRPQAPKRPRFFSAFQREKPMTLEKSQIWKDVGRVGVHFLCKVGIARGSPFAVGFRHHPNFLEDAQLPRGQISQIVAYGWGGWWDLRQRRLIVEGQDASIAVDLPLLTHQQLERTET